VNTPQRFVIPCLLAAFFCLPTVFSDSQAAPRNTNGEEKYVSQELIDTSIQRGFILLNESADMAGVGFRHQRSIVEAKKIVRRLKEQAKGDPNEKYIFWKAGELEAQIYLEESDLMLQQMQKRQLTINELVAKYNTEVGKWRPDFATLYRIHKSMGQVDQGKANELADSYNQRKRAISREAAYFLEKALVAGDMEKARKEVGYCLRNQLYLDISESTYKRFEDRVEGLINAKDESPRITAQVQVAGTLLNKKDITEARRTLDSAANRYSTIKEFLPQRESITMSSTITRMKNRLGAMEDSLVDVNVAILRNKGVDAADKYLQTVVRPLGVSREKAASVDRMIISVSSPEDNAMRAELEGLDEGDEPEENPLMDDIMFAARKKARKKMDSLQAIENARMWRERQEQARRDSIEQARLAVLQAKVLRADSISMTIYGYIERNDLKTAKKILDREKKFLREAMKPDEFAMLGSTIHHFSQPVASAKSEVTYIKPVEQKQAKPQQVAARGDAGLKSNLDRAQEEIVGIYAMLEKNDVARAYRRFQVNRSPLQKYLAPEAFSMLEMSVTQAYEFAAQK
jgi:hypothetical protein